MVLELLLLAALQPDPAALVPLYRQALAEREKQYGPEHPKVARAASDLGLFLRNLGDRAAAAVLLRRALAIDEKALAPGDPVVGEDLENLASVLPQAEALALLHRAAGHPVRAIAARNLARLAAATGDAELYRRAIEKEDDPVRKAARLNDLGLLVGPEKGKPHFTAALALQERALGRRHPETASTLNNLANSMLALGRLQEAHSLLTRSLAILEDTLGPQHPRVAIALSNLADIHRARRQYKLALEKYRRALAIDEAAYGPDHPEVAADRRNLAALLDEMGKILRQN